MPFFLFAYLFFLYFIFAVRECLSSLFSEAVIAEAHRIIGYRCKLCEIILSVGVKNLFICTDIYNLADKPAAANNLKSAYIPTKEEFISFSLDSLLDGDKINMFQNYIRQIFK